MKNPKIWLNNDNLNELIEIYKYSQICIFTGAGASFTSSQFYSIPGWRELLRDIYENGKTKSSKKRSWKTFEQLEKQNQDPWDLADSLILLLGSESDFQDLLVKSLISQTGRDKIYKRLPLAYLNKAGTLNAIISFCSEINYFNKHQCLKPSEKVKSIMTLNYDWYIEGGATQKYNAAPFKPMVDNFSLDKQNKLPVYHLHGYIPHDFNKERRQSLIMSSKSYKDTYQSSNSWTKTILDKFIPHFTTIFIGLSFNDVLLVKYFQDLASSSEIRHYFFWRREDFKEELLSQLVNANIYPIWISDFNEIPIKLKNIYISGLTKNKLKVLDRITGKIKNIVPDTYCNYLIRNKK